MPSRRSETRGAVAPRMMAMPPVDENPATLGAVSDPLSNHAAVVNEHYREAKQAEKQARRQIAKAVESAFQAGLALIEMKKLVKHGEWTEALKKKCPEISQRTANRFMSLAREYKDRPDQLPQRPLRELYGSGAEKENYAGKKKAESSRTKKENKATEFTVEVKSLRTLFQQDDPASVVLNMNSKDREKLVIELQKLIKLLTQRED